MNCYFYLDLSCGEYNVISLYFLCCSVNGHHMIHWHTSHYMIYVVIVCKGMLVDVVAMTHYQTSLPKNKNAHLFDGSSEHQPFYFIRVICCSTIFIY